MEQRLELSYIHYEELIELPDDIAELIDEARIAALYSVATYSQFRVGAAARLSNGVIVRGGNVESEVYPAGICAERNLLFNVATNYPFEKVEMIAIISTSSNEECYPCGACRQTILDTERRQGTPIKVVMAGGESATIVESATLLLPFSFKLR